MTRARSSATPPTGAPVTQPEKLEGLLVRGTVTRRWRKILDTGTEVVSYEVSGVPIQVYSPEGQYFAIGEEIEVKVNVSCYQTKSGIRYSLVQHGRFEGEF